MAITKFNSIDGYTVNESTQITVVDANANFYANNLTVTAASDLGAVGNVKITGGTANYILQTNGSGVLSWTNPGASGLAGSNREVQFNNDGNFGASSNFTFNSSTNLLTVGNLTVTSGGTSNLGNLATANYISGNGYGITGLPLGNLSDVVLSYPSTGQILTYNGVNWINGSAGSSSAGQGVKYWLTSIAITASSVNNSFEIDSLSQTPYTPSSTLLSTSVNNNTLPMAAWETNALNRTIFDAGSYDFSVYANINAVGGTNTFELDFYQVIPFVSGTVTITGSGTSRTATASTGTPFSGVTASGTNTTSSWLQTPNGLYQITAKTNDTVVTISTPSGYSNENAVAGQVWNQLFKSGSMAVVSTVLTEFQFSSTQPSFNVTVASKLGIITFVTSNTTKTLTFSLDGSVQDSHFTTPWVILHNDLAGLQGGTNEEYFHLTTSEYTANGTGTFIRQSGATLITPNVGVASGTSLSVTGNISSGNANLGNLATANYFSGNGIYLSSLTGANVTGTVANANYSTYAGTVITAAQPNITSIGTLVNTTMGASNSLSGGNLVSATYLSGTITTGAQPNITSLGTLTSLTTTANMTSGNADLGNLATANYFSGNGIYISNIAGANVSGTVANANYSTYAGTVIAAAQPNITSVGTLNGLNITGNLVVTGNLTVNGDNSNLSVTNLTVQDNTIDISAETTGTPSNNAGIRVIRGDELSVQLRWNESQTAWQFTNDGVSYQQIVGKDATTGNVSVGNISAGNLVSATYFSGNGSLLTSITGANITGTVANANYSTYAGTVITAAQPNITSVGTLVNTTLGSSNSLSGGNLVSATYLTGTLTTAVQPNVTSLGSLSGLTVSNVSGIVDFNITSNVTLGTVGNLHISGGTSGYVLRTDGSGVLSWVNPASAGLAGSNTQIQFNDNSSFGADANLTFDKSTDTLGTKNIVLEGPGSLTGGNLVSANYLTGTLTTKLQPNITSVGTLANLNVGGDATVAGNFTVTGTTTFINVDSFKVQDPIIELGGGPNGAPLITNDGKDRGTLLHYYNTGIVDAFMGWDNSNAEFAFGSSVSVASEVVTFNNFGNVRANYFLGNGSQLTGIIGNANYSTYAGTVITAAQPNITSIGTLVNTTLGASNSFTGGNLVSATYLTGALTTGAQPNVTSVGTLTSLTVTGNITSGNADLGNLASATYFSGNGILISNIAGANVSGQVGNALLAGTVYTNAQPNITSVGSLSGLTVSNATGIVNFTTTANVTLGAVANLHISGGTAGAVLSTDGSGALTWTSSGSVGVAGTDTQIQFNDVGNFGADGNFTFAKLTSTLSTKNITLQGTGNLTGGNLVSATYLTGTLTTAVQPNVTSLGTLASLTVTGNVSSGNANLGNLVTSNYFTGTLTTKIQPNITSVGTLTELTVDGLTNLGDVGNLTITGGTAGYSLTTDGYGALSWQAGSGSGGGFVSIIRNSFTGNGVQTNFNLTTTPTGEAALLVNLNGLIQIDTTYSLSGSTLIFSTAPASGAKIEVTVYGALAITETDTQILFISGSSLSGSANFTFDNTTNTLSTTRVSATGNVSAGNVKTDNLLYANGSPYIFTTSAAGSDTQVQYNNSTAFGASANFTFNNTTKTLTVDKITANGAGITYITGANVNGNVTSAVQAHYANIANSVAGSNVSGQVGNALVAGTVYTNAQPNITSVGTLASLTVTANISSGNANLGNLVTASYFTGNGIYISNIAGANVSGNVTSAVQSHFANIANSVAGSNVSGQVGNALVAGTVYTNAQPNITSVGTLSSLTVTANISSGNANLGNLATARYFSGDGGYLSNLQISTATVANANYANFAGTAFSITGSNVSGQVGNALVAGTVYTNAQPNITSVGTLSSLTVTANISSGNANLGNLVTAAYFSGNGIYISNIAGANVYGNVTSAVQSHYANIANSVAGSNVSGQVGNALVAGTVYTNAQPNITSVGTLTSLTVSGDATVTGNFTVSGNTNFINVDTVRVKDPIIELGGGVNGAPLTTNDGKDRGTLLHYYTTGVVDAFMGWDNSNAEFAFGSNVSISSEVVTFNNFGNVRASYFIGNGSALTNITGSNVSGNVTSAVQSHFANIANSIDGSNVSGQVGNALVAGTVYTNAQPNITSVGTLASLTVTANITSGNANLGNLATATYFSGNGIYIANITGANVNGNVTSAVQAHYANIANSVAGSNVSGQVGNALVAGTVYTNAQPNITSVGTLTSLTVTANISSGNANLGNLVTANFFSGDGGYLSNLQISSATVANANYANFAGTAFSVTGSNVSGQVGNALVAGTVYTNAQPNITSVGTLDNLTVTGNITSGNANLGNLATASYFSGNGIYISNIAGANVYGNVTSAVQSHFANIANSIDGSNVSGQVGNASVAGTVYTNAQPNITSVGTLASLTVTGNITSGNASLGNLASATYLGGTLTTGAQPNITSVGILTSLRVTGNVTSGNANLGNLVTANYFSGDGGYLSNLQISSATVANANYANFAGTAFSITGSNVSGQVGNALVAGTVYTNAQPNITSVGTLTSLTVTGNITSGNADLGNLATASYFSGNGVYLSTITGANVSGNVTSAVRSHFANIANYVLGSDVSGTVANANYATWSGISFESFAVSGPNVVGGVANANYATYSGSAFSVTGSNVSGQVGNALVAGTVYTNAQPNITSVGALTSLSVSNATGIVDFTTTANVTLGNVSNLHITGGTAGYVLKTDGAGNLSWGIDTSAAGGNTTEIQFNDSGSLNGNTKLTFDKTTGLLTVTGNIATTNANLGNLVTANYFTGDGSYLTNITGANVTGNVSSAIQSHYANIANSVTGSNVSGQVSNALVAGTVYTNAQPNITSVGTLTSLDVTGNITSGNANLGNLVTATYFSGNGSLLTGLPAGYANSNVAAYLPTYTGNVSANYFIGNGSTLTYITGANVTGNVTNAVQSHFANIANSVDGSNVSGQVGNALVAGTVYTNAQPNITSVGTLASLTVTGNITSGNASLGNLATATYFSGDGSLLTGLPAGYANSNVAAYLPTYTGNVSANYFIGNGATLTYITGANVNGNVTSAIQSHYANIANSVAGANVSGQVANALVAGTVYTNAQPNITSLGTLTALTVNGITTLGTVGNVKISGGTSGYVLTTNGSGDVSWQASGGSAGPGFVNIIKNSYVADGSQTAFILTTTPASEDAILVNIDGILQQDAAYTLSGSTVTMASAPYLGEVVEITVYGTLGLGANTQVIFNDAGNVGATSNFIFNKSTNLLTVSNATVSSGLITLDTGTINVSSGNATIFTSGISNITVGSTSSNVISQGNLSAKNYSTNGNLTVSDTGTITSLKVNDLYSNRTPVNVSTNTIIDSFPVNKYRSAKYTMRVNSDDGYQAVEVLLIHDGSDSFVTIYGSITTSGTEIISLSSSILSGAVRVLATTTSTNTTVNLMATYVAD